MRRRVHTHQKNTRILTQQPATAPAQEMFQQRPFGQPSLTADSYRQPDLKTSLIQAERYGHHLSQMQDTDVSPPQVTQPKLKLEQEADTLGAKATQGEQVQVAGAGSGIQRQATSQLAHNCAPVQLAGGL